MERSAAFPGPNPSLVLWDWLVSCTCEEQQTLEACPSTAVRHDDSPSARGRKPLSPGCVSVLAFPSLSYKEVTNLVVLAERACGEKFKFELLSAPSCPIPAIAATCEKSSSGMHATSLSDVSEDVYERRTGDWVERVLVNLRICPFTSSRQEAGGGLSEFGISPASILYSVSVANAVPILMRDFWQTAKRMLEAGPKEYSSILLAAPFWDDDWERWKTEVFPLLEENIVISRMTSTLGIVCFHPTYSTPDPRFISKHFGHMHSVKKLRQWLENVDPKLSVQLSDEDVEWAGSYQRRTPHATINVLWCEQLEAAERKRSSQELYTRNIRRLLKEGRECMEAEATRERSSA